MLESYYLKKLKLDLKTLTKPKIGLKETVLKNIKTYEYKY